ncbi:hypothetical protein PYCC9005_001021 [Savitreella phatthalungensis]
MNLEKRPHFVEEAVDSRASPIALASTSSRITDISGLEADEKLLRAQGHKGQLPRQFTLMSLVSLAFGTISSELGVAAGVGVNLTEGGASSMIYGTIVGAVAVGLITLGMAELSSAFPSAGAQYHWAYCVASDRSRKFSAYITAWFNIAGWLFGTASLTLFCGTVFLGIGNLYNEDFAPRPWQFWLCYLACNAICASVNILLPRRLPAINTGLLWLQLLTWLVSIVVLCILARDRYNNAGFIFTDMSNLSGWSNNGIAYMIAVCNSMYAYIGTDAAAHLAEEVPRPQRTVPLAMLGSIAIGLITALPFSAVLMLVLQDKQSVIGTTTGLPYLQLCKDATGSNAAATVLIIMVFFCFLGSANAGYTAVSRLIWAFSRDNGMPFSDWLSKVHSVAQYKRGNKSENEGVSLNDVDRVPMHAILLSFSLVSLWGLIYIGSTTAFNAFLSAVIVYASIAYAAPQAIMLFGKRGRSALPPHRLLRLPNTLGYAINAFSVVWAVLVTVIFCLPPIFPVTQQNASYISVVVVGVPLLAIIFWFAKKHKEFHGPQIDSALLSQAYLYKSVTQ